MIQRKLLMLVFLTVVVCIISAGVGAAAVITTVGVVYGAPSVIQITTDPSIQVHPDISGVHIVWEDYRNGNADIYMYDISTGTETQITTDSLPQFMPKISGDRIVWEGSDIYMYDISTGTESQITTDLGTQQNPDISGDIIVWQDYRNSNRAIYMYDISTGTEIPITTDPSHKSNPAISGDIIVWEDYRNGNWDIYMYDISTGIETPITANPFSQEDPAISGDHIVWEDYRNGISNVYMYDISTGTETQLTNDTCDMPAISGDIIVWRNYEDVEGISVIHMYNIFTGLETKIDSGDDPAISGNVVVWEDVRNDNWDIYVYYTPTTRLPPEITPSRLGINTHWNHWAEDLSVYKQKTIGFGIVRDQAWWAGLETSDLAGSEWASANWNYTYNTETLCGKEIKYQSGLDNLVKLYQDDDSPELLLLLNLKNDNISSFETITADQYYDYVYHVVERYDGDGQDDMPGLIRPVSYFEVGNEVDYIRTGDSRHGYLSPKDYVEKRLIPAYNAAKAANKDAVIMGSGLGMESDLLGGKTGEFNTAYLEAMYDNITDNGGSKNNNFYMDKIAIHYYSQNEHPELFDENIKEVENVIIDKEGREKAIWITEFAPASPPSLYARLLTLMFANRIEMPVIYNLKDDSESGFGLYDVTCEGDEEIITPRESIQVIDTILSTLHNTIPSETENENIFIEPGKTTYKRVFNNLDKKVTVLWYIDTAAPGAVINYEVSPESPQTFTVDVLGTANFSQTSPILLEIGSEPTYVVEAHLPIDVDLYFNRTTTAGVSTERATSFAVGDTLYGKIKTSVSTDHLVKTYITITMPDGTCRYAYYDKPDFTPGIDRLLFSDKKVQLYDGLWHATTDDWLWNIYEFTGGDSGIYAWNCWYEDSETGEILGGDSTEYIFSTTLTSNDEGLVAEWHFDENSGNILRDTSGNGNNGTIYGANWTSDGKLGSALQFDGVDDYVEVPDSPELSGGSGKNMTIEFWFNSNKQYGCVITKFKDISYKDWGTGIGFNEPGLSFYYEKGCANCDMRFYGGTIKEGVWHHGAFTFKAESSSGAKDAELILYLDGQKVDMNFWNDHPPYNVLPNQLYDMPDTIASVGIGYNGKYYNSCYFDGKIDEVSIYNHTLNPEEINAHYEQARDP
jgi:TolB protein